MTEFSGIDVVVKRPVSDEDIREAVSAVVRLPRDRVTVIDDISDYPERQDADVVCVISTVDGELSKLLSIQSGIRTLPYETHVQFLQTLCEQLGSPCMAPDEQDEDPFVMWLVSPGGTCVKVGLDPVALDEERYVITRELV